jgi:hypothetical protein
MLHFDLKEGTKEDLERFDKEAEEALRAEMEGLAFSKEEIDEILSPTKINE